MTATKDDGGKEKRETETLRGSFYGVGGEMVVQASAMGPITSATVAASDRYLFARTEIIYPFSRMGAIKGGWQWTTYRFDKGTTVRVNGGYVGAEISLRLP